MPNNYAEIGYQGENIWRPVTISIADLVARHPGGYAVLMITRPGEREAYIAENMEQTADSVIWTPTDYDTARPGVISAQAIYSVNGEQVGKTAVHKYTVNTSLSAGDGTPYSWEDWVNELVEAAAGVDESISEAEETLDTAVQAAQDAQTAAETAQEKAEEAQGKAEDAQEAAETAERNVNQTKAAIDQTKLLIDEAKSAVDDAKEAVDETADEVEQNAEDAEANALKAEGYAVGTQDGTPSTSGQPYFHDNAKYYKEQSESAKDGAVAAKNRAEQVVDGIEAAGTAQVQRVTQEGGTQVTAVQNKGQEVLQSIPEDYTALTEEVNSLSNAISVLGTPPDTKNVSEEDADFDISDPSGNVLVRFEDGHIKTKYFDSSDMDTDAPVENVGISGTEDFDISDSNGNVLVQFKNGHIKTKAFDSADPVAKERLDYSETVEYSGAVNVEINKSFVTGDTLIFHTSIADNNVTDSIGAYLISYYGITPSGNVILLRTDYGWNFPKITIDRDYTKIRVALPNGLTWNETRNIKVMVYHTFGNDIKKKEITVKHDGSGHYTNLKDALSSMTDNNALTQYIVKVYPGTYNVFDDFTDEEILDEGFKGLIVMNGVYVEGVGQRDDIIVNGHLDGSSYDTVRNNISPLNMAGDSGLSNLTIIADHMRYCIHDDIGSSASRTHIFKDLTLRASSMTSASAYAISYGAGYGNMKNLYFESVDFGDAMSAHGTTGWTYSPRIVLNNCTAKVFNFTDYDSVENVYIKMNNCKGIAVRIAQSSGNTQKIRLDGVGTNDIIMDCYSGFVYNLGQCRKYEDSYSFSVGQAVKLGTSYGLVATTDKSNMIGIVLGKLDGDTYIQTDGYLDANTFGITGLSVGDYVHLDTNGVLASGGSASDAVGIVIGTNSFEGGAFIKMI